MLGTAYSLVFPAVNRRLVGETLSLWVVALIAAFGFSYALAIFL